MAGIDLTTAQSHLDSWLAAELIVTNGQSTERGGRRLTLADLADVRAQIQYWDRTVKRLSRGTGVSAQRAIVHD